MKKLIPVVVFLLIFFVWIAYPEFAAPKDSTLEKRGQHGDMYGGLNTLFSGLAFAGLIYTAILQREELGLQREELKSTREELERTAKANELAAAAMAKQVKNQLLAARISAITAIVDTYNDAINTRKLMTGEKVEDLAKKRNEYIRELIKILENFEVQKMSES